MLRRNSKIQPALSPARCVQYKLKNTMSDDAQKPDSNIKSIIDATTGLVKAIPVYQDAIQPSAQQIGKSLETVTKTVNIALAPIKALVWGYEKIEQFITRRVSEKLKNVPSENITTPEPQVAGPTVEALRYTGHDENLRELFANLLATSMDKSTLHKAHPGYVDIIKNISSDEANILKVFLTEEIFPIIHISVEDKENSNGKTLIFSKYSHLDKLANITRSDLLPSYLDNLCRLGILESPQYLSLTSPNTYEPLEQDEAWLKAREQADETNQKLTFERGIIRLTDYGKNFVENVVKDK